MSDLERMAVDLRTMHQRVSELAASDFALLQRAADVIEAIAKQKPR